MSDALLGRWLQAALICWGVGVLFIEALASVGMAMALVGVGASVVRMERAARLPAAKAHLKSWWPLYLFVAWGLLRASGTGAARLLDWPGLLVAAWAASRVGVERMLPVLASWAVVFMVSCVLAAFQHFGVWPAPEVFEPLAWTRMPFYRVYEEVPGAPGRFMAGGLLSHRLKFAHTGGLAVLGAVAIAARARGRVRVIALVVAAIGFLAVLWFPFARMASVALVVSGAAFGVLIFPRRRLGALVGAGVLAVAAVAVAANAPLRARFLSAMTSSGSGERGELLATGARAVQAHPIAGVGAGKFRPALFAAPQTPQLVLDNTGKAHNQLLSIAAETGAVGLVLFLLALAWIVRRLPPSSPGGPFGLAVVVFFGLVGLTHDPLYQAPFSMGLALALGLALAAAGRR